MTNDFVKVGRASDFPDNEGTAVEINGRPVCVVRTGSAFHAVDNRCTHAESRLSGGDIEDGEIVCPLHGARFSLETGAALTLPAVKPVRVHAVEVRGDDVFVKLADDAS